jgi:hypothetical protein
MDASVLPPIVGYALARRHQLILLHLRMLLLVEEASQPVNSFSRREAADSANRAGLLTCNTLLVDLQTRSRIIVSMCERHTMHKSMAVTLTLCLTLLHANNGSAAFENISSVDVAFYFRL